MKTEGIKLTAPQRKHLAAKVDAVGRARVQAKAECSRSAISKILLGRRAPSKQLLTRICKAVGAKLVVKTTIDGV